MQYTLQCASCGAEIDADLAPGEVFECPDCGAELHAPSGEITPETPPPLPDVDGSPWPSPVSQPPAFTPNNRVALFRAFKLLERGEILSKEAERFVLSMYSSARVCSIDERRRAGADISEFDELYFRCFGSVYAEHLDKGIFEFQRQYRKQQWDKIARRLVFIVLLTLPIAGCVHFCSIQ
jgi:hypothetical protein